MYKITKDNENNIEAEKNNSWWNIEIKNAKIEKLTQKNIWEENIYT